MTTSITLTNETGQGTNGVGVGTSTRKETSMTLEQFADALLDGTMTVAEVEAQLPAPRRHAQPLRPAMTLVEDAPQHASVLDDDDAESLAALGLAKRVVGSPLCACDRDQFARALFLHREGVQPIAEWDEIRAGLRAYNALPKWERRDWLAAGSVEAEYVARYFATLEHVRDVEQSCPAAEHYRDAALEADLGRPVFTSRDPENIIPSAERWDELEHRRLAWPVVPFQHHYRNGTRTLRGDGDRGYRADPTAIHSDATLEREYGPTKLVTVTDYERDEGLYVLLDEHGSRRQVESVVKRTGEVEREYQRRRWVEDNGRLYLPFLPPKAFKRAADFLRGVERKRQRRETQRQAVAVLLAKLGHSLEEVEVAEWVERVGYEAAVPMLVARLTRQAELARV